MFYDRRAVTIRKPHKCWGCNREFPKGTEMAYDSWIDAGNWNHGYFCSTCVDLINEYCKDYLDFEFCRGDLLEDALEYENRRNRKKDYIPRKAALKAIYTSTAPALEVKAMPAADVVPVRHGRWIKDDETGEPICSVCHSGKPTRAVCSSVIEYKLNNHEIRYCYYCGAKMDGGQDDV